ncbi:MAG: CmcI family methyltransferase [Acidimicrobiia bacterium]
MTSDDRERFDADRRRWAMEMQADGVTEAAARDLYRGADAHNWPYQWDWLGLPVIQMPADIVAVQEIVWATRPQLVIETGVARGGSLALYASILELIGEGEVLGIDIDIRAHNRAAIEAHPLAGRITLLEGSSVDPEVVRIVSERAAAAERVMVVLDSDHSHDHVVAELRAYAPLVTVDQFLVVADTMVEEMPTPEHRARPWGKGNSPASALRAWQTESSDTLLFEPDPFVDAKLLVSASLGGYLRRIR